MKKLKKPQIEAKAAVIEQQWIASFVQNHGSKILTILIASVAAAVIFFQFIRSSEAGKLQDYLHADRLFQKFLSAPAEETGEAFEPLRQLMASHPDLKQKYEGKAAQALIGFGQISAARPYIDGALERVQNENIPLYLDYSETSVLIAEGDYEEAYHRAETLQNQLAEKFEKPENDMLFAFNLLRLATLQQQLGLASEEQKTLEQILAFAEEDNAVKTMLGHMHQGRVSLQNYIEERLTLSDENY